MSTGLPMTSPEIAPTAPASARASFDAAAFIGDLLAAFAEHPVEDGFGHGAEVMMRTALARNPAAAARAIECAYNQTAADRAGVAADLIRCVGALAPSSAEAWSWPLIERALAHADVAVRDAAAGVLEHSGGERSLRLLRTHVEHEQVAWLAAYIRGIIADLETSI